MKLAAFAAALALATFSAPAMADGHADAPTEAAASFSLDTPIEALMADEGARAAVLAHLPGMDEHPAYDQFKSMTLVELQPWSQGLITEEILERIGADLAALS